MHFVYTSAVAESPVAIKRLAGCMQQLRRAALQQQPDVPEDERCTCTSCQMVQQFLKHPDQRQSLALGSADKAQHVIKYVNHMMVLMLPSFGRVCNASLLEQHYNILKSAPLLELAPLQRKAARDKFETLCSTLLHVCVCCFAAVAVDMVSKDWFRDRITEMHLQAVADQ